ncbi:nSTAND1 domain-containing NTPase [Trichothermofontia sp.]
MSRDAVVVGINRYQYLSNLQAPARDAEAIAQCLHTYGDFRVNRLPEVIDQQRPKVGVTTPVTRQELETALIQLFKPKGKHIPHTALFYYSGHGLQKDAGIQEGYLATSDANPSQGMYGLSLFWLRRLLQESPVRQRIVLLDCCHSGELLNFLEADPGATAGTDRLFMAASREYEAAYESLEGAYSVFTQAVLTGLDPQRHGTVTNYALTNWVSHALKGELQQPLFECSGREIILTTSQAANCRVANAGAAESASSSVGPIATVESSDQRCPFPGLRPLTGDDPSLLPSQNELIQTLLDRLHRYTHVTLTGASGSGKTSLLHQGLLADSPSRCQTNTPPFWQFRYITPGDDPLYSLALAFVASTVTGVDRASQLQQAIALLDQGGAGLVQLCNASLGASEGMILVVDQLESLLLQVGGVQPWSYGNRGSLPTAYRFLTTVIEATHKQPDRIRILWCVRQDYLVDWTHCTQALMPDTAMEVVTLAGPTPAQIQYALTDGLAQVGLRLEPHLLYTLSLELCVREASPQENRAAALPLLQWVLRELWQRSQGEGRVASTILSAGTYAHFDGIRGLIHRHADTMLASFSPAESVISQRLLLALIHLQTGQAVVPRRVRKEDLLARVQTAPEAKQVLEALVAARLLVLDGHNVEVCHPELVRSWPPLQTWIAERRDILYLQQQVEQAAYEWQQTPTALSHPDGTPWTTQAPPSLLALPSQGHWLQGDLLTAAVRHYEQFPHDFSLLAQRYIALSHREQQRLRRQTQWLRAIVPLALLLALGSGILQYRSQVLKEYQLRVARSRERAAISQTILQDPQQDPTSALLISRVAVEQDWRTPEAQASLRSALQRLQQLAAHQGELPALQGLEQPVSWAAFIQPEVDFWQTTALGRAPATAATRPQVLVTATRNGQIQYWHLQTGAALKQPFWLPLSAPTMAEIQSTGQLVHTRGTQPAFPSSAAPAAAHPVRAGSAQANPLTGFAISPEGRWLATTQFNGLLTIYRLQPDQTFERVHALPQAGLIRQLAFSPLSNRLLGIDHNRVLIWDLKTGELVQVLQGHQGAITHAHFSHDGWQVATSSWDQTVALWAVNTGELLQQWSHSARVTSIGFSPDDRELVFADEAGTLATIKLTQSSSHQVVQKLETPVVDVQFDPTGRSLITTQANGRVQFWDEETGTEQGQLPSLTSQRAESMSDFSTVPIQQVLQSPDGWYLTIVQADGHVTSWAATWESLLALARDRSLRQLTPDECRQYLKLSATACPVLSLGDAVSVATPPVLSTRAAPLATSGQVQSPRLRRASPLISLVSSTPHP